MPDPTFTSLSPAEQRAQHRPAQAFPTTNVVYSDNDKQLLLTAQHWKSTEINPGIPMKNNALLASVALRWAVLTNQMLRGEPDALRDHCKEYAWLTYPDTVDRYLDQAAAMSPTKRNDIMHAAHQHYEAWEDSTIGRLTFDEFVEVLAGTRCTQPLLLRVPLLHWLTSWAAHHSDNVLACPVPQCAPPSGTKETGKVPGPRPLGKREWEVELGRRQDDKSVLMPDALVTLRAKESPGNTPAPTWVALLDDPLQLDDDGLVQQLESLAQLSHVAAEHAA